MSEAYVSFAILRKPTDHSTPPSSISRPPTKQHRQIPLIRCLLDQLIHRRLHAQTATQLLLHHRQRPIRLPGFVPFPSPLPPFAPKGTFIPGRLRLRVLHLLHAQRRQRPAVQRIVAQNVENGHDAVGLVAQGLERELAAATEDAFGAGDAHGVDEIAREAKWHNLGHGQDAALLKGDAEVNVHDLARFLVEQDVVAVAITEAKNVAEDGDGGRGTRVREAFVEPVVRAFEALHEKVAEHRVEVVADLAEGFDAVVDGFGLGFGDVLAADVRLEVFGEVALVGGYKVVV